MRGTELLEQLIVFEVTFNIDESISYLISSIYSFLKLSFIVTF